MGCWRIAKGHAMEANERFVRTDTTKHLNRVRALVDPPVAAAPRTRPQSIIERRPSVREALAAREASFPGYESRRGTMGEITEPAN
jgi:hypothetical protein